MGVDRRKQPRSGGDGVAPGNPDAAARPDAPAAAVRRPAVRRPGPLPPGPAVTPTRSSPRRSPAMTRYTLRYVRYALSCLSAVAFKLASN